MWDDEFYDDGYEPDELDIQGLLQRSEFATDAAYIESVQRSLSNASQWSLSAPFDGPLSWWRDDHCIGLLAYIATWHADPDVGQCATSYLLSQFFSRTSTYSRKYSYATGRRLFNYRILSASDEDFDCVYRLRKDVWRKEWCRLVAPGPGAVQSAEQAARSVAAAIFYGDCAAHSLVRLFDFYVYGDTRRYPPNPDRHSWLCAVQMCLNLLRPPERRLLDFSVDEIRLIKPTAEMTTLLKTPVGVASKEQQIQAVIWLDGLFADRADLWRFDHRWKEHGKNWNPAKRKPRELRGQLVWRDVSFELLKRVFVAPPLTVIENVKGTPESQLAPAVSLPILVRVLLGENAYARIEQHPSIDASEWTSVKQRETLPGEKRPWSRIAYLDRCAKELWRAEYSPWRSRREELVDDHTSIIDLRFAGEIVQQVFRAVGIGPTRGPATTFSEGSMETYLCCEVLNQMIGRESGLEGIATGAIGCELGSFGARRETEIRPGSWQVSNFAREEDYKFESSTVDVVHKMEHENVTHDCALLAIPEGSRGTLEDDIDNWHENKQSHAGDVNHRQSVGVVRPRTVRVVAECLCPSFAERTVVRVPEARDEKLISALRQEGGDNFSEFNLQVEKARRQIYRQRDNAIATLGREFDVLHVACALDRLSGAVRDRRSSYDETGTHVPRVSTAIIRVATGETDEWFWKSFFRVIRAPATEYRELVSATMSDVAAAVVARAMSHFGPDAEAAGIRSPDVVLLVGWNTHLGSPDRKQFKDAQWKTWTDRPLDPRRIFKELLGGHLEGDLRTDKGLEKSLGKIRVIALHEALGNRNTPQHSWRQEWFPVPSNCTLTADELLTLYCTQVFRFEFSQSMATEVCSRGLRFFSKMQDGRAFRGKRVREALHGLVEKGFLRYANGTYYASYKLGLDTLPNDEPDKLKSRIEECLGGHIPSRALHKFAGESMAPYILRHDNGSIAPSKAMQPDTVSEASFHLAEASQPKLDVGQLEEHGQWLDEKREREAEAKRKEEERLLRRVGLTGSDSDDEKVEQQDDEEEDFPLSRFGRRVRSRLATIRRRQLLAGFFAAESWGDVFLVSSLDGTGLRHQQFEMVYDLLARAKDNYQPLTAYQYWLACRTAVSFLIQLRRLVKSSTLNDDYVELAVQARECGFTWNRLGLQVAGRSDAALSCGLKSLQAVLMAESKVSLSDQAFSHAEIQSIDSEVVDVVLGNPFSPVTNGDGQPWQYVIPNWFDSAGDRKSDDEHAARLYAAGCRTYPHWRMMWLKWAGCLRRIEAAPSEVEEFCREFTLHRLQAFGGFMPEDSGERDLGHNSSAIAIERISAGCALCEDCLNDESAELDTYVKYLVRETKRWLTESDSE